MIDRFFASVLAWLCATTGFALLIRELGDSGVSIFPAIFAFVWLLIGLLPFGLTWSKKSTGGLIVFAGLGTISCSIFLCCVWYVLSPRGVAGDIHTSIFLALVSFGSVSGGLAALVFGLVCGFLEGNSADR